MSAFFVTLILHTKVGLRQNQTQGSGRLTVRDSCRLKS
jgi:hypothetical protein